MKTSGLLIPVLHIEGTETKKYHMECQSTPGQIKNKLEDLANQGAISEYTRCAIIDMSNKVLEHIAAKYDSVREGVKAVMGGKILEYEAKTIKREGVQEGIEKGVRGTVKILKNLGIPPQTIEAQIQEQYHLSSEASKKYL